MVTKPARQTSTAQNQSLGTTKAEIYRLHHVLGQLKGFISEPRYVYTLVLLRKKLQAEIDTIDELNKPPDRIQEFEAKRLDLCKECSSKGTDGSPIISPDKNFVIDPGKHSEFQSRMLGLQEEYKKDIEAHHETINKINALVLEPSEIGHLPKVPLSALSGSISVEQMEALFPIVIDDTQNE